MTGTRICKSSTHPNLIRTDHIHRDTLMMAVMITAEETELTNEPDTHYEHKDNVDMDMVRAALLH